MKLHVVFIVFSLVQSVISLEGLISPGKLEAHHPSSLAIVC